MPSPRHVTRETPTSAFAPTRVGSDATEQQRIAVCVPVRDESAHLTQLLDAFACQTAAPERFVLCLLFDGCNDDGEARVAARRPSLAFEVIVHRIERAPQANAGRARRAAMALGLSALAGAPDRDDSPGLLLSTDADSVPAPDWVEASAHALASVDVVAGYIERPDAPPQDVHRRVERYWERLRCLQRTVDPLEHDPAPSHPSQGGASLGFRAEVYQALGGFEALASHEDVGLVTAARRAGYRVRHDRTVRVATSSRIDGRASRGLAYTLRQRQTCPTPPAVQDPEAALHRYRVCAEARAAFARLDDDAVAQALATTSRVSMTRLRHLAAESGNAEAFTMYLLPEPEDTEEIALEQAEQRVALLESTYGCPCP
ncbi:glycosyltransferase [Salinisphaera dokdonensis]|uniref:glycosyltransferase n=1 Tax=Salinisphaera dokdonensis TaxID=454598 RepID=UPI00333F0526